MSIRSLVFLYNEILGKPSASQSFLDFRLPFSNSSPFTADHIERNNETNTLLQSITCQALSLMIRYNSTGSFKDYISIHKITIKKIIKYSHLL